MSSPGLVVEGLAVNIGSARIVSDVSLHVAPGQVVGLAGRNGAGKTTTLRAISGVLGRTGGSVRLDGTALARQPEEVARQGVAHVPEGRGVLYSLTVEQNVRLGRVVTGKKEGWKNAEIPSEFPLLERYRKEPAGRMSGGIQQMLALARGLASDPRILMVDEMSLGLSPMALSTAVQVLAKVAEDRQIGVLIVDQNTHMLMQCCTRIWVLTDGRTTEWNGTDDIGSIYFS